MTDKFLVIDDATGQLKQVTQAQALAAIGASSGVAEFLEAKLGGNDPIVALAIDDHINFDTVLDSIGTSAVLDTTTPYTTALNVDSRGRVTLLSSVYLINLQFPQVTFPFGGSFIAFLLINADTGEKLGVAYADGYANSGVVGCTRILRCTAPTRIEVRVLDTDAPSTQFGNGVGALNPVQTPSLRVARLGANP